MALLDKLRPVGSGECRLPGLFSRWRPGQSGRITDHDAKGRQSAQERPPQCVFPWRGSSTVTVPLSSSVRSRRPVACARRMPTSGTLRSMKAERPWASSHSRRAYSSGLSGTENGSFAQITWLQYSPGRSTPSARLAKPSSTERWPASMRARWRSISSRREHCPYTSTASRNSGASAACTSRICRADASRTSVPRSLSNRAGCGMTSGQASRSPNSTLPA